MKGSGDFVDKALLVVGVLLLLVFMWSIPIDPDQNKHHYASYNTSGTSGSSATSWSYLRPSKGLSPQDVVQIQLKALQQNDGSDSGIITVFNFSSPVSKISMGPIEHFRLMVRDPVYKPMLNFKSYKKGNMVITGKSAYQLVVLTSQDDERATYLFMLARQTKGYYKGCWMTVGVVRVEDNRPVYST
ncbi:DUF4864 domain-containing protein [Pontibacter sp. KCTC 32443]|uniref:DUF4864 domain-containing protein n=1 Tax=Pontibacter TaxID=323449 RepID=UPI00164D0562|nr:MULTISPECIES: DUF4864 domain-containing protein [Pontibacter]MBC5776011.1 DUF4864 domain-containing protein [Pontibacter sp. KCTC 32443]